MESSTLLFGNFSTKKSSQNKKWTLDVLFVQDPLQKARNILVSLEP